MSNGIKRAANAVINAPINFLDKINRHGSAVGDIDYLGANQMVSTKSSWSRLDYLTLPGTAKRIASHALCALLPDKTILYTRQGVYGAIGAKDETLAKRAGQLGLSVLAGGVLDVVEVVPQAVAIAVTGLKYLVDGSVGLVSAAFGEKVNNKAPDYKIENEKIYLGDQYYGKGLDDTSSGCC